MANLKSKYANILVRPRITEKATFISESGVYAFEVADDAKKEDIKKAVQVYFEVTPVKVRTVRNPQKRVIIRGKRGIKPGVKKAYVYLKKGEKLNLT